MTSIYPIGGSLIVHPHISPPPSKSRVGLTTENRLSSQQLSPADYHDPVRIRVEGYVSAGIDKKAQVLKVVLEPCCSADQLPSALESASRLSPNSPAIPRDRSIAAKLYDPLLFPRDDDVFIDPFLCVQRSYAYESTAYSRLAPACGQGIPYFYGSFFAVLDEGQRVVHGILMELIEGVPLTEFTPATLSAGLEPRSLTECDMQGIVEQLIVVHRRLWVDYGVCHGDMAPRNLILSLKPNAGLHALVPIDEIQRPRCVIEETPLCHPLPAPTEDRYRLTLIDFDLCLLDVYFHGDRICPDNVLDSWLEDDEERGVARRISDLRVEGWITWDWEPWVRGVCARIIKRERASEISGSASCA